MDTPWYFVALYASGGSAKLLFVYANIPTPSKLVAVYEYRWMTRLSSSPNNVRKIHEPSASGYENRREYPGIPPVPFWDNFHFGIVLAGYAVHCFFGCEFHGVLRSRTPHAEHAIVNVSIDEANPALVVTHAGVVGDRYFSAVGPAQCVSDVDHLLEDRFKGNDYVWLYVIIVDSASACPTSPNFVITSVSGVPFTFGPYSRPSASCSIVALRPLMGWRAYEHPDRR